MSEELAKSRYSDMDDKTLAKALASSGYFDDSKVSQALTKMVAGREMGFGPVTSLKNIHFVQGNIEVGGQLIASKIRQSDKYDYVIKEHTDDLCTIAITDSDGKELGEVTWDIDRAKQASLDKKDNWSKYPRNMLFNRAISDARRFYCPDVMETGPYTPGEIPTDDSEDRAKKEAQSSEVEEADFEVEEQAQETSEKDDDEDDSDNEAQEQDEATPEDHVRALLEKADDMDVDAMMDYAENTVDDYDDKTEGWRQVYAYLKEVINGDEELEITDDEKLGVIPF